MHLGTLPGLARFKGLLRAPNAQVHRAARAPRRPGGLGLLRRPIRAFVVLLAGTLPVFAGAMTPPGTLIPNVAEVTYVAPSGEPELIPSNPVEVLTVVPRTSAEIVFFRVIPNSGRAATTPVGPAACGVDGGRSSFTPLPSPVLVGGRPIDPVELHSVADSEQFHAGEPFFFRLSDADQDLDVSIRDTAVVTVNSPSTGDSEVVRLLETGVSTGVFTGYVPSAGPPAQGGDCVLQVEAGSEVSVSYQDPADPADVTGSVVVVDPFGRVFDSRTGQPVDGARIVLVDAGTGLAAPVLGDDGLSAFPSELLSGGQLTDNGGQLYVFEPGSFRFPFVAPGDYRLVVEAPAGYTAPSTAAIVELQTLPGSPYALGDGSFGGEFSLFASPGLRIDIPLDPAPGQLFVQKTTLTATAAPGDFLQYTVSVENTSQLGAVANAELLDTLPAGFRYLSGSTRINEGKAADPAIAEDGRTLRFGLGDLAAGEQASIRYAVEVTVGVRGEEAENIALARGDGDVQSNVASARVQIVEDLFRSHSTLVGRVVEGGCQPGDEQLGVAGVRIYLEDGRYTITDDSGRYHFEGVKPGTHVVQVDLDTVPEYLELVQCQENSRFAGSEFSRFVDLRPGALWRANFHLREQPAASGATRLGLESVLDATGARVSYTASLSGGGVPVSDVKLMILLPEGQQYVGGSSVVDARAEADPIVSGPTLRFDLGRAQGQWKKEVKFTTTVDSTVSGELSTKAIAMFDTPVEIGARTPTVENSLRQVAAEVVREEYVFSPRFDVLKTWLKPRDKAKFDVLIEEWRDVTGIRLEVVGHTDDTPIAAHNTHIYADNHALSLARAAAVAEYFAEKLQIDPEDIVIQGKGADEPVASNETPEGRALNRRVELTICGDQSSREHELKMGVDRSGLKEVQFEGASGRELHRPRDDEAKADAVEENPYGVQARIESLGPEIDWLYPAPGYNPPIPSLRLAVKHAPGQVVELLLDGTSVSALNFDGTALNRNKTVAVSQWRGVDLDEGANTLTAIVRDADQNEVTRLSKRLHYSGGPQRALLLPQESILLADGKTRPVISLQMFDRTGHPARPGTVGPFRVDPPYRSWWEVQTNKDNQLIAVGSRQPIYTVDDDGVARIELEPTSQSGEVVLHLRYPDNREEEYRAWLRPEARDWVLVGLAEGTVGYNVISDNVSNAQGHGLEDDLYEDGRLAFFAKGRIKGEFLLTLAYDSARDKREAENRLLGTIDPDRFYPLYGDGTEQRFEAASQEKLFLKLERNEFFALFGDYETGLTVTELSRYNRSLNGLKTEYHGQRVSYSAFATRTTQAFVKDEIRGDGTSGPYPLSRRPIIINSEKVTVEVHDRFRSQDILESRTLTRHLDYNIDYYSGTVIFKEPMPSRDQNFNPLFLVVDYESRDGRDESTSAGGRGALTLAGGSVELGATVIHEGQNGGEGNLHGLDLGWRIGEVTEFKAEAARSDSAPAGLPKEGSAYLAELTHRANRLDGRVYVREQQEGFGIGQQRATESATRKAGFDGRVRMNERVDLAGEVFQQDNLAADNTRQVAQAELRYQGDRRTFSVGLRSARDEDATGAMLTSNHATASTSWQTFNEHLTMRASTELSFGGANENIDYPSRSVLGLDYQFNESLSAFGEYEFGDGEQIETKMTRVGLRASPWQRAQFNSTLNQQFTEYGPRVFANLGLAQGWQVNERWAMDLGIDQSNTLSSPEAVPFADDVPLASGSLDGDFLATYIGSLYRGEHWTFNSRLEFRKADTEDRWGLLAGFYREESAGRAFSARAQLFSNRSMSGGEDATSGDIRLGWAFRPEDSRWTILDRLDLMYEDRSMMELDEKSWRAVNNLNANWMPNLKNQYGFQYGSKLVRTNFDAAAYTGYTDLIGLDLRRDLNTRWDFGVQASVLHSWESRVYDAGFGVDLGLNFAHNFWVSVGYNFAGFHDDDFARSRYTAQGPFIRMRFKADQQSLKDALAFSR